MNSLLNYYNLYKLFVTIFIIYCWVNYYVFKKNKALPILLAITIIWLENTMNFVLKNAVKNISDSFLQGVLNVVYEFIVPFLIFYFYYKLLTLPIFQKIQIVIGVLYILSLGNSFLIQKHNLGNFYYQDYLSAVILIILSIIVFFLNFMLGKEIIHPNSYLPLWISLALVIVYVGLMPILYLGDELSARFFNWVYYSVFIIGESVIILGIENYKRKSYD